jgi:hypothetical protein
VPAALSDVEIRNRLRVLMRDRRSELNDYQSDFIHNITRGYQRNRVMNGKMREYAKTLLKTFGVD